MAAIRPGTRGSGNLSAEGKIMALSRIAYRSAIGHLRLAIFFVPFRVAIGVSCHRGQAVINYIHHEEM